MRVLAGGRCPGLAVGLLLALPLAAGAAEPAAVAEKPEARVIPMVADAPAAGS